MEDPDYQGSGYYLFGRDLMAIPCLRTSALAGFATSFGVGVIHFLLTSHASKSIQYAQFGFIVGMFPYAFYCQDQRYKQHVTIYNIQETIKLKENDEFIMTDSLEFGHDTYG